MYDCKRFHLVGTVSNNEEYSIISTNIHKLDKVVLMDYSGLAVGWREAWWLGTRIRSLDRAIPILGLICQFFSHMLLQRSCWCSMQI